MHKPSICSQMLALEIWNWIIPTFWCNRHDDIHVPQCDHRHWMLVNMRRSPAGSRTWFFRSSRGHGRPPLKAFSLSHLDRVFRPLPQEALQADQGDQSLSLQSSGHGMWHTSSVYPGKEHWRSLTQIITVMMLGRQSVPRLLQTWTGFCENTRS